MKTRIYWAYCFEQKGSQGLTDKLMDGWEPFAVTVAYHTEVHLKKQLYSMDMGPE